MQNFKVIADTQTLTASLPDILNNDQTALSNSSGTAFPTTNLHVGMFCLRTDQMKLYQLKETVGPTWVFVLDLAMIAPWGQFAEIVINTNLDDVTTSGWYHQSTNANATLVLNYPVALGGLLRVFTSGDMTYQFYSIYNTGELYTRARYVGAWSAWRKMHDSVNLTKLSQLQNDPNFLVPAQPQFSSYREVRTVANVAAAYAVDCATSNVFALTLTGNTDFTFTNVPANVAFSLTLALSQDVTGSRVPTWPGSVRWPNGVTPTLTTTPGKTDFISLVTFDGGTSWFGMPGSKNH